MIETIFGWPGIGRIAMEAIHARDYNLLMATSMFGSFIVLFASLVTDILYTVVDPRVATSLQSNN